MASKASKYLDHANTCMMKKSYSKAIRYFAAYLELVPSDRKAMYSLADAYSFTGENKQAITLYLQVADDFNKKHFLMKAIAVCKKVLKLDPNNIYAKDLMDKLYKDKDEEFESTRRFYIQPQTNEQTAEQAPGQGATEGVAEMEFSPETASMGQVPPQQQPAPGFQPPVQPGTGAPGAQPAAPNASYHGQVQEWQPPQSAQPQQSPQFVPQSSGGSFSAFDREMQKTPQQAPQQPIPQAPPQQPTQFIPQQQEQAPSDAMENTGSISIFDVMQEIKVPAPAQEEPIRLDAGEMPAPTIFGDEVELVIDEDADYSYAGTSIEEITGGFKIQKAPVPPPQGEQAQYQQPVIPQEPEVIDMSSTVKFYRHQIPLEMPEPQKLTAKNLLFEDLDRNEYRKVVERMEIRDIEPGQPIVKEGDPGDSMFIIVSGEVNVHTLDKRGKLLFLAKLKEGDFFGEISLLTGKPRTATIIADTPTELLELKRTDLPEIEYYCPNFRSKLEAFYKKRMRQTVEKIVESQYE
jgi:hypothetical protein